MIQILNNKIDCCGCAACQYACPVNAISMEIDTEGFWYPNISSDKCIGCNKCTKVCAFKNDGILLKYINSNKKPISYAVKHRNDDVRQNSRSGGIFTALSDYVLQNNGVIYGAVMNDDFSVTHLRAETESNRNRMRGSKYVQSDISMCYGLLKEDLEQRRMVLFSGTSCQIAAIKSALGKEYDNLYTVDIVCHGVPSPLVWKDYVDYIQNKYDAVCVNVDFRNKKKYGWSAHVESLELKKNNHMLHVDSRYYSQLFYTHLILRPSCSACPYKSTDHPGDITIADYWGIKKAAPEFFDQGGISLVLVNSKKGSEIFEKIEHDIEYKKTNLSLCMQPPLQESFPLPKNRDEFWHDYKTIGIEKVLYKYVGNKKDVDGHLKKLQAIYLIKKILGR